jgi:hypothetical protein
LITRAARCVLGFLLPALCNVGVAAWLAWHLMTLPEHARRLSFQAFVWFYAIGGLTIVLSCAAAFLLMASDQPLVSDQRQRRRWLTIALINTTVPSLLMLALMMLR